MTKDQTLSHSIFRRLFKTVPATLALCLSDCFVVHTDRETSEEIIAVINGFLPCWPLLEVSFAYVPVSL